MHHRVARTAPQNAIFNALVNVASPTNHWPIFLIIPSDIDLAGLLLRMPVSIGNFFVLGFSVVIDSNAKLRILKKGKDGLAVLVW
jgi:hypothetical protein